jgi:hypothetical protein
MPSLSSILKYGQYQPHSVGYLSACFHHDGAALPSPRAMAAHTVVFDLRDEICARHPPIVVTMEAHRTAILTIQLASERSAETWQAHVDALGQHHFHRIGMASARGRGLVAGSHAACPDARWGCARLHACRDLFDRRRPLARKAYAALAQEDEATHTFHHATSEAHLHQRLHPYEHAHHACEQAIARYDQLALRLHLLHDAFHRCSPCGRLRTIAGVRSELLRLCSLSAESDAALRPKLRQPLRSHLDAIFAPFGQAEATHAELLGLRSQQSFEALGLAWHHAPLSDHSFPQPKRDQPHASQPWLDVAEGLLDHQCALLQVVVFEKLDAMVQASALVELVHAFMRPSLHSSTGHISQETVNLIMFDHNHRRYQSGKRPGKAPMELLPGEAFEVDWIALVLQHTQGTSPAPALTASSPLALVSHDAEPTTSSQMPPGPEALASSTEVELAWSPMDAAAAYIASS